MFLRQDLPFFLAWVGIKTCNGSNFTPGIPPARRISLEENIKNQVVVGLITCKFTITSECKMRIA